MGTSGERLLGLDVGSRRIGVALSQGSVAVPLTIIEHDSRNASFDRIAELAREHDVAAVVVGLPVGMSGDEGAQARRTRAFGDALAERSGLHIAYQDERLSTAQAARAGGGRAMPPRDRRSVHPARRAGKTRVDDLAAAVILQAYIDAREARG